MRFFAIKQCLHILKDQQVRSAPRRKRRDRHNSGHSIFHYVKMLVLGGFLFTILMIIYTDDVKYRMGHMALDTAARILGYYKPVYAVIIDAGSTGSRVLAFSFHEAVFDSHLVLDKELFEYTKPGLSAFAEDPKKAVESIAGLLEKAKKEIPPEYWENTPLVLRATAGLRLLPPEKAEGLLKALREFFKKTPFKTNNDSVSILEGTDEGIFSWFTVNFLLDRINYPVKTVAALDLGGGSTQVTFSAMTPISLAQKDKIHEAASPKGSIQVFTESFLGLGLMAARQKVIQYGQSHEKKKNVTSECVNPVVKGKKFRFGEAMFFVSGLQENYPTVTEKEDSILKGHTPIVDWDVCSNIIVKYVRENVQRPEELHQKQIFAFSYYFDRAAEVGLIDEVKGGQVVVEDFKTAAVRACGEANVDQPFMCMDLTFIWALLDQGFGLRPDTTLSLYKKIAGHEISWALGQAYDILRGEH